MKYASTNGGSVTLGRFQGYVIGITCQHVLKGYKPNQFVINEDLRAESATGPVAFFNIVGEREDTAGSEIEDLVICVWQDFFQRFPIDELVDFDAVVESEALDRVVAVGFPKDEIAMSESSAEAFGLELHMHDIGRFGSDDLLRIAGGLHSGDDLARLTGFSGGLVFNMTKGGPTGVVVRGGIDEGEISLYYVPLVKVLGELRGQWHHFEERLAAMGISPSAR